MGMSVEEMAAMGGKARAEALSAQRRREIAQTGGKASGAGRAKKAKKAKSEAHLKLGLNRKRSQRNA